MTKKRFPEKWAHPYHEKWWGRLLWSTVKLVSVITVVSVVYFWALENVGFETTVVAAVWFLLMSEFSGPNPYTFKKWVDRAMEADYP